jgi:hypothetical protein
MSANGRGNPPLNLKNYADVKEYDRGSLNKWKHSAGIQKASVLDSLSEFRKQASNALSHLNPLPSRIEEAKHILDNRRKKKPKDENSPQTLDEYNNACEFLNNAGFTTKLRAFTPERLASYAMDMVAKLRVPGAQGGKKRSRKYRKNRKTRSRKNRKTRSRK